MLNIGHILVYSLIEPCQEKLYDKLFFVQRWIVSPRFSFHFFSSFKSHTVNLLLIIVDLIIHIYGPTMILYIDQQAEANRCMIWWCSHYLAHISKPFCTSCFFDDSFYIDLYVFCSKIRYTLMPSSKYDIEYFLLHVRKTINRFCKMLIYNS